MNKFIALLLILFSTTVIANKSNDSTDKWKDLDNTVKAALQLIANDDFLEAVSSIDRIKKRKDNVFAIHDCLKAAMYYKIAEEYQNKDFEEDFNEAVNNAIDVLAKEDDDTRLGDIHKAKRLQFLGSAYGYRGMYRTLSGQWGGAFMDGKRANDVLEESYKLDNTLVDNMAGVGTYLYWRSAKAGIVKYLLLWGDRKKEGIDNIKLALEKGRVVRLWAMGGLLRIYMEEKRGKLSIEVANDVLAVVPRDTGTLRKKAFVSEKRGDKEDALKIYIQLLPLFKNKDGVMLWGKKLNTVNAQVDSIYNILRLSKELKKEVDTSKYVKEVESLKDRISSSYSNIAALADAVIYSRY